MEKTWDGAKSEKKLEGNQQFFAITKNSISKKKTDKAQPLALNKLLKLYERSPSQQHVARRQLIRKQKNVPKIIVIKV